MIRILLVDDQRSIRESIKAWLEPIKEFKIVGTASDGYSAIEQVEILKPDVVLIDMEMPVLNGVKTTEVICQKFLGVKVIVLSMHDNNEYVLKALQAGATGYLLKNTPKKELIEAISFVYRGYSQVAPGLIGKLVSNINETPLQSSNKPIVDSSITKTELSSVKQKKPRLYILLWLIGNALIWSSSILYLQFKQPDYTSKWTIALPASNSYTNIDLPDVGQASSQNESPYNSDFSDPRENYRYLALSNEVIERAANSLNMTTEEFGQPNVEIPGNTTLIEFQIDGDLPKVALNKAKALHTSLATSLEKLRNQEKNNENQQLETTLETAEEKLNSARENLNQFQLVSGLSSTEQASNLVNNIEQLRKQRVEVIAQQQKISSQSNQLRRDLGLTTTEAADALLLQSDAQFKQYLSNYVQAKRELINLRSNFSEVHPGVIAKQAEIRDIETALYQRGAYLLGRPFSQNILRNLNADSDSSSTSQRATLFQQLISLQAEQQGLREQASTLEEQISELETKLAKISRYGSQMQKLQRELQLTEAIFSSTATKLELINSQNSASYPPMSLFSAPSLPKSPSSPKTELVILGSAMASLLLTTGLFSLWWRGKRNVAQPYLPPEFSKNESNGHRDYLIPVSKDKITTPKP